MWKGLGASPSICAPRFSSNATQSRSPWSRTHTDEPRTLEPGSSDGGSGRAGSGQLGRAAYREDGGVQHALGRVGLDDQVGADAAVQQRLELLDIAVADGQHGLAAHKGLSVHRGGATRAREQQRRRRRRRDEATNETNEVSLVLPMPPLFLRRCE